MADSGRQVRRTDLRAADAAVATSAALNVTEPGWCGIGGFVGLGNEDVLRNQL